MLYRNPKASLIWPFFLAFITALFSLSANSSEGASIEGSTKWQKLNYYQGGFLLPTTSFLVSKKPDRTSLRSELEDFVLAAKSNPELACKFPARYSFLYERGLLEYPLEYDRCPDLGEYLSKVPADSFYYIYAAENITSVTSMMGHGFLMAEGLDKEGVKRQHTYSYFAELNSLNPINLFYGAMFSGLNGKFALHPYRKDLNQYLDKEQREVWSYKIKLTQEEIVELQLLLWELKGVDFTYHFHSFNCATLLLHALSIIRPQLAEYEVLFVSPLDIAKALEDEGVIEEVSVTLPRSLDELHSEEQLITYQYSKKPTLSPQDSILTNYWKNGELNVALLPTSHLLRTPSSYRNSNNELRIGYIDYNISSQSLNEIVLYGFKDYKMTSNLNRSSEIYIGYRPTIKSILNKKEKSLSIEYLSGLSKAVNDVQLTALIGFSIEDKIAIDAKANISWSYNGASVVNAFVHNKRQDQVGYTFSGIEASLMVGGKYNLFIKRSKVSGDKGKTSIGLDYHF